ncbi:MAG: hypothetical protein U5L45_05315 [Saprospiraceae bacterium]|nr:hypothetical protein [Saprospiraceae bacterium]
MKYLITFTNNNALKVVLDYGEYGLNNIQFEGHFTDVQKHWILSNTPPSLGDTPIEDYLTSSKIKITLVAQDLTFANFWNKYNHKHGSKPRAEKLWKAMSDADKMLALQKLKKYLFDLANSSVEQCHASTWLQQRRFEN